MSVPLLSDPMHAGPTGLTLRDITREDRARMSGPALRTFANIAGEWGLSERDRLAVLGQPGRSTCHGWFTRAAAHQEVVLPLDTLLRISAVLGIYKALRVIFPRTGEDLAWLRAPNSGPLFGGQSPLSLVISGSPDGILLVRRYLDAWCTGQAAGPLTGDEAERTPIADEDLAFV